MNSRREQVWVGLFVLVAAGLLIGTVLSVAGTFSRGSIPHRAYYKFAGGLEPGARVRFGGMKAGSVQRVRVDPDDPTRIEVDFNVAPDLPLKTDSVAKISSLGPLGDNYLELTTGTRQAAAAGSAECRSSGPRLFSRHHRHRAVFYRRVETPASFPFRSVFLHLGAPPQTARETHRA
jgi:ABC-type transporter Mla subunit MlaD